MAQRLLKWLVLLALLLFIAAVAIFLFGKPSFSEDQVVLELDGPAQASAGDEVTYKIKYENKTKLDLSDLKFKFTYPEESVAFKDGKIMKDPSETFSVDNLQSGKSGEKEFKAFLVGERGDIKSAKVSLEFKAGNLRSSFEKTDSISTTIISVPISLTLVAPPSAVSGQAVNYLLDYRNESGDNISDIKFEFDYPDGFTVQDLEPKPSGGNAWSVPLLKRGAGGRISIRGVLSGREGEVKTVSVFLKRNIGGEFVPYQKASTSSLISNPLLSLEILANGTKNYSTRLGDRLQYVVKYKNNSNFNLIGLNLTVKLEGEMYDPASLDTGGGFYDSSSKTILWHAGVIPNLASLPPQGSGEVKFAVTVKNSFPAGGMGSRNFSVKASAKLSTPNVPSGVEGNEVSATSDLLTRISTKPVFSQVAYYDDPAFGSSGPLPPETGKETIFTVHWQITNPGNDMNQVKVRAVLPPGITWKNIVSVGLGQAEPSFNANSSEIVWDIGVLPQGVGVSNPKYDASFQVGIKPSLTGQAPILVKDGRFLGIDSFTKEEIVINASDLTTDDLVDRPGEGAIQ